MIQLFVPLLTWIASSLLARVLVGAGLSLASYAFVGTAVDAVLANVQSLSSGLHADVAALLALGGAGQALSLIGGALVARAVIVSAGVMLRRVTA